MTGTKCFRDSFRDQLHELSGQPNILYKLRPKYVFDEPDLNFSHQLKMMTSSRTITFTYSIKLYEMKHRTNNSSHTIVGHFLGKDLPLLNDILSILYETTYHIFRTC